MRRKTALSSGVLWRLSFNSKIGIGQLSRLTVSFDMTFLALVLGSLYEPSESLGSKRCPIHPTKPQAFAQSEFTDYAADLSVAFAYHKLLDDWA